MVAEVDEGPGDQFDVGTDTETVEPVGEQEAMQRRVEVETEPEPTFESEPISDDSLPIVETVEDEPVFEQPEQEEVSLSFDEQTEVVADVTFEEQEPVFDEPETITFDEPIFDEPETITFDEPAFDEQIH